jgi:Protein of unknown function (DUF3429)
MQHHAHLLARALTLAGAIPFVALAIAVWTAPAAYHAQVGNVLIAYAAIILSFLGGIQWGGAVALAESAPRSAQTMWLLSVIPSLLAWAMLFVPGSGVRVIVAICLFAFVWVIDALLHLQKLIPNWFFRLRTLITGIVIASLLISLPKI